MRFDLAVIGSASGATAAAFAARNKGRSVVMIERGTTGGTCVNTGCVPSKALLAATAARQVSRHGRFPGIAVTEFGVDLGQVIDGKRAMVESLRADKYIDLAAQYGRHGVRGRARFVATAAGPVLEVSEPGAESQVIAAEHYLIATGSTPWAPSVSNRPSYGSGSASR